MNGIIVIIIYLQKIKLIQGHETFNVELLKLQEKLMRSRCSDQHLINYALFRIVKRRSRIFLLFNCINI
jgi:hypothetical protein